MVSLLLPMQSHITYNNFKTDLIGNSIANCIFYLTKKSNQPKMVHN
jgi:hypothetical protein